MKVHDVMDKYPVTVTLDTNVKRIAQLMDTHHVPGMPVVDEDNRLLGIVSQGDVLYKKVRPHAPHYVNILGASIYYGGIGEYNENFHKLLATEARELMTKEVITCCEDADIEEATSVMLEKHLKIMPVLKGDRVVGVITRQDIIHLIAHEADGE